MVALYAYVRSIILRREKKFPLSDVSSIRLVRPGIRSTLQVRLKNYAGMAF